MGTGDHGHANRTFFQSGRELTHGVQAKGGLLVLPARPRKGCARPLLRHSCRCLQAMVRPIRLLTLIRPAESIVMAARPADFCCCHPPPERNVRTALKRDPHSGVTVTFALPNSQSEPALRGCPDLQRLQDVFRHSARFGQARRPGGLGHRPLRREGTLAARPNAGVARPLFSRSTPPSMKGIRDQERRAARPARRLLGKGKSRIRRGLRHSTRSHRGNTSRFVKRGQWTANNGPMRQRPKVATYP